MSQPTRAINLAKQAAKYLDSIGETKRAEDVRALVRSNATYRGTLQQLHRDNMALRAALGERK